MPSRCIFFFSARSAWSTLLSRTRTCTVYRRSIERIKNWPRMRVHPRSSGFNSTGAGRGKEESSLRRRRGGPAETAGHVIEAGLLDGRHGRDAGRVDAHLLHEVEQ